MVRLVGQKAGGIKCKSRKRGEVKLNLTSDTFVTDAKQQWVSFTAKYQILRRSEVFLAASVSLKDLLAAS